MPPRGKNASNAKTSAANTAKQSKANGNGANLGFEAQLFLAADKLRKSDDSKDRVKRHGERKRILKIGRTLGVGTSVVQRVVGPG